VDKLIEKTDLHAECRYMCSFLREITCHHAGPTGQTLTQNHLPVARWMEVGSCGQFLFSGWPPLSSNQDSTYPDTTGHSWIASGPTKATAHPVERCRALQHRRAPVANAKRCNILLLPTVKAGRGCSNRTQLMTLLPKSWRHTARKCTRQQEPGLKH